MESSSMHASLVSSHIDYSYVWELMCKAKAMTDLYEQKQSITSKYVHATSRGHEAIQIALGCQLKPQDFVFPYYRDDSMLLAIGMSPYDLMLQLLAKQADPFSGGRTYYSHPSLNQPDKPKIPHQSSATGMQAIPATGVALGLWYREQMNMDNWAAGEAPISVCSLGDASITEGEVAEAFQMAVLKSLPILYLVQDNEWDISAHASEFRAMDASEYAKGFKGLEVRTLDGTDFVLCYQTLQEVIEVIRTERRPILVHAKVPLLNHHTSGVRKEWYRDDLEQSSRRDPILKFRQFLNSNGYSAQELNRLEEQATRTVLVDFEKAMAMPDPLAEELERHIFADTPILEEMGERHPEGKVATLKLLRAEGTLLTYVGDGINDAPALAEADIGIAMGNGTDIAIESADVVLMTGELGAVVNAVLLARATMRNIKENLFWAFAYNVALIPLATGALYPAYGLQLSPVFAAGAMALSSVFVLGNALRLKRFRPSL